MLNVHGSWTNQALNRAEENTNPDEYPASFRQKPRGLGEMTARTGDPAIATEFSLAVYSCGLDPVGSRITFEDECANSFP